MTPIAIDGHKKRSTLAYVTPGMTEPQVVRCYSTRKGFARVLAPLPKPWVVCIESSRQSPPIVRWLRELGAAEVHLVNAHELHKYTQGKPKTDARDAKQMLSLQLMGQLPECYLACHRVQDLRALTRTRTFVRKFSTATRNAIRALLNQLGLEVTYRDLTGVGAQEQLRALAGELGPLAQVAFQQLLVLLAVAEQSLDALDAAIREQLTQEPVAQALMQLRGIGPVLALGLLAELGTIERFEDPAHLISYAGLAPRANDSDEFHGERHLPRRCNTRLRHLAIQATQSAVRCRTDSRAGRTYGRLVPRLKPNVAKIAAARALMTDVFYTWQQAVATVSRAA